MTRYLLLCAGVLAVLGLCSGCGGGDGSTAPDSTATAPEKANASPEPKPDREPQQSSGKESDDSSAAAPPPEVPRSPQSPPPIGSPQPEEAPRSAEKGSDSGLASTAAFRKQAQGICAESRKQGFARVSRYVAKKRKGSPESQAEALLKATAIIYLPMIQEQIDQIGALPQPEAKQQQIEAFLAKMQQALDTAMKSKTPLTFEQLEATFHDSSDLARGLGLAACTYG